MAEPLPGLVITRPIDQAKRWVDALSREGLRAAAVPLVEIAPPRDPQAVAQAWQTLAGQSLVMFVSGSAARCFFDAGPPAQPWPQPVVAACTGPGTAAALRELGLAGAQIVAPPAAAGRFDSEALWSVLSAEPWRGKRVLIVRGDDGRDWLAERFREAGAVVDFVAAYSRRLPTWTPAEQRSADEAIGQPRAWWWLFSSSEALRALPLLRPQANWRAAVALATHPRVAAAAREIGFPEPRLIAPTVAAAAAALRGHS